MRIPIQYLALIPVLNGFVDANSRVHLSLEGLDIDISNVVDTHGLKGHKQQDGPSREYVTPAILADYQIDVDHGLHQGFLSADGAYVKFSNIPYAAPPNNNMTRFGQPTYVEYKQGVVHDGAGTRKCSQASPGWISPALEFLKEFSDGTKPLDSKWSRPIGPGDYGAIPEVQGDEDCLYLDVMVPKTIWEERNKPAIFKPAVVVWIHGGGFVLGSKYDMQSPEGLFKAANKTDEDNIVFVSINYRLGMFGWMAGEKFQNDWGTSNLGLYDQREAIGWVARNIHRVGGDSRRITVMGQSAGGASIVHQLTFSGGYYSYAPLFQKAIIQSPGFFPSPNDTENDGVYSAVLKLANASDLDALANVDAEKLRKINQEIVWNSTYGQFTFGPSAANSATPNLPGQMFKYERFHRGVSVLLGYTGLDGLLFTPPWVRTGEGLRKHVRDIYKGTNDTILANINERYPLVDPKENGVQQRLTGLAVSNMFNDIAIKCNIHFATEANKNTDNKQVVNFRYAFNANPPVHGNDLNYAFYPERPLPGLDDANQTLAARLQQNLVDFIRYSDPNVENSTEWKPYSSDARKVVKYGHMRSYIPYQKEDFVWAFEDDPMTEATRKNCEFWRDAPYYPPKSKSSAGLTDQSQPANLEL